VFGCVALSLIAWSCGSASQAAEEAQPPAASAGDEPPPTAAQQTETPTPQGDAPDPAKPARGGIVVQATCNGQPVEARGHMPIERGLVVDFEMGQEFSAQAGTRHIEVALADEIVLVDKPTLQLDVAVEPRKVTKVSAVFPWAEVQLNLLVRGIVQPPTPIKLIRGGNVVASVKSGGPAFRVSPGNYEADVAVRGKTVRVKGLAFFEGTQQVVPVRAQP
jgi:hypothetical protein